MADQFSGFLFDVERWFGSVATQRMSFAEKGVYLVMLFQQWRDRTKTLPDDVGAIADLIAVTPAQRAEVEASWEAVRRKFVTDDRTPTGRMFNAALERTRRKQRASWLKKVSAGRSGGKASARKRRSDDELDVEHRLSTAARPSTDLICTDLICTDLNRSDLKRESVPRAHNGTVFEGTLPRDHVAHVFCDPSFSICVPSAVHAKFIGPMSRRFGGDRQQAHDGLKAWYAKVAASLAADFVMGDAFKFWQPQFDAEFATKDVAVMSPAEQAVAYQAKVRAEDEVLRKLVQEDDARKARMQ